MAVQLGGRGDPRERSRLAVMWRQQDRWAVLPLSVVPVSVSGNAYQVFTGGLPNAYRYNEKCMLYSSANENGIV